VITINTKSEKLLNQLGYLTLTLDADFLLHGSKREGVAHAFRITGKRSLTAIQSHSFLKNKHEQILSPKNASQRPSSRIRGIPVKETLLRQLARKYRTVRNPRIDSRERTQRSPAKIQIAKLLTKSTLSKSDQKQLILIKQLIESDIGFAKVTKITKVNPSSKHVYCFEVDSPLAGFVAGKGGVFTHNCFGYLGFRASRFGRVEAYECVTAFSRRVLLDTKRVCEQRGFQVLHGIVDCVWLQKPGASVEDYIKVGDAIRDETGLDIEFEGRYRWIVFLPSKTHPNVPVLNRYYGVFDSGKIKVRGIETRRSDTPKFINDAQMDIIQVLAKARNSKEFIDKIPEALKTLMNHAKKLMEGKIPTTELLIAKRLSKNPRSYTHDVLNSIAAKQLIREGVEISAGQTIQYLITRCNSKSTIGRVQPAQLLSKNVHYDSQKYLKLLFSSAANILEPFGCSIDDLHSSFFQKDNWDSNRFVSLPKIERF